MFDVVKSMRQKPFGEWNVVYYDAAKTDPEKLEKRLRDKGCPDAKRVEPKTVEKECATIAVENPIATPGDFFSVTLKLPEKTKGKMSVRAPDGWTVQSLPDGRALVLSPKKEKAEKFTLQATVTGGAAIEADLEVELVGQVK